MSTAAISAHGRTVHAGKVPFLFGFFLSARILITLMAFQSQPSTGSLVTVAGSFAFVFFAWTFSAPPRNELSHPVPLRWLAAYLALIATSLFWSYTESAMVAFAYWAALVADCTAVYLLMTSEGSAALSDQLLSGFVVGAAFAGFVAWCLPTLSDLRIGNEDFLHPNALGYVLALATILGSHLARRSRIVALLTVFCGATLLRTISKACIAGCAIAVAFYLLRASHLTRRLKIAIYALTAGLIVSGWTLVEAYVDIYDRASHIETLTGRTYIWSIAWEEALKTPWLGHGFYSFRFVIPMLGDFVPWQAHNEALQQFFSYGILGFLLFVFLYASFWRFLYNHRRSEWFAVAFALMLFVVVRGIADTERFDLNYPLWLLTLLILVIAGESKRQQAL